MTFNDFDVIVYKTLAYLYECIRAGVTPNIAKARELTKVSEIYWDTVLESLLGDRLVTAGTVYAWEGHSAIRTNTRITQRGAAYVTDNLLASINTRQQATVRQFYARSKHVRLQSCAYLQ